MYPVNLIPMVVEKVPSMHVLITAIAELIVPGHLGRRIFGINLVAELAQKVCFIYSSDFINFTDFVFSTQCPALYRPLNSLKIRWRHCWKQQSTRPQLYYFTTLRTRCGSSLVLDRHTKNSSKACWNEWGILHERDAPYIEVKQLLLFRRNVNWSQKLMLLFNSCCPNLLLL